MKLNLDELHTLKEALGIANTHVNNDVVTAEYAGERCLYLEEYLKEIKDLQKRIDKKITKLENNQPNPDYDGQPDEAQEWHDFDPDC